MVNSYEEHKLQCFFCQLLDYKLVNPKKGYYFSVPNGDRRGGDRRQAIRTTLRLKHEGLKNGVADCIVLLPKRVIFVEMKTEKGVQSSSQKEFERIVKLLGFEYVILRNTDDCEKFVNHVLQKK